MKKTIICLIAVFFLFGINVFDGRRSEKETYAEAAFYEAENPVNILSGRAGAYNSPNCSGAEKIGFLGNAGGSVEFTNVYAAETGKYRLTVFYSANDPRRFEISANGGSKFTVNCPSSGGWDKVGSVTAGLFLNKGSNKIRFENNTGWAPDLDGISVEKDVPGSDTVDFVNGNCRIEYNLRTGTADFYWKGSKKIKGFYAGYNTGIYVTGRNYTSRTYSRNGSEYTVTSTGGGNPVMKQHFYMSGEDYFLTRLEVAGKALASDWMGPVVVDSPGGVDIGSYGDVRVLNVPFDNDHWVRYNSSSRDGSGTGYEAGAIYDNSTRNGLVLGSVTHDVWKTGIYYSRSNKKA